MNCEYCGYFNEEPTETCGRCGADIPEPTCQQCGTPVDWGEVLCEQCKQMSQSADRTPCPSCGAMNNVSAEYCTSCGTPMAVMTQVTELARAKDRDALETWRVYGIETDLVGRDEELAELEHWMSDAVEEDSKRAVAITGDTGFGKSRLVAEFQRRAEERFAESIVLESSGRDDSSRPYGLFARLFKNRFYIGEDEAQASARNKFREAVGSIVESSRADRVAHLVGHAIGIPFDRPPPLPPDVDSGSASTLDRKSVDAMVELLEADARANPLLVIFDDLQHEKSQSLRALARLIGQVGDVPALFLLSWNPKDLRGEPIRDAIAFDSQIELQPLSDPEVEKFVRQTLRKAEEIPDGLVQRIVDSAHGVPLSVEEMLRILISKGVIDTRQDDWKVDTSRIDEVALPTTVEETVRARLAALSDDERRVLEMAACIGNDFWPPLVRALYHLRADREEDSPEPWFDDSIEERIEEVLESLERKDMIRRRDEPGLGGHDQFSFKHRIEREALYDEISRDTKRRYHRLIAQWIEREVPDDELTRFAEQIAEHYDNGRCLDRAAPMYIRAAEYAADRFVNDKAIELFTNGLGYSSDADIDLKMSALHDLGSVYVRRGEYDQALAYFREMLRCSWIINDTAKGGAALNKIGRTYRNLGEYDEALDHLNRALGLFWDVSDLRGVASTLDDIGKIHWIRGDYDEALRYYDSGLELRRDTGHRRSIALSLSNLGSLKFRRGLLDDAERYYRESLELRREIDARRGVADSYNNLGALHVERGAPERAVEPFEEGLEIARNIGHHFLEATLLNNLGEAHLRAGADDRAADYLDEAREVAETAGDKRVLHDVHRNRGRLALERESFETARERVERALEIAESLDSEALAAKTRLTLADVFAEWCRAGGEDAMQENAEKNYQLASETLQSVGNRALLGRCLSRHGAFLVDRRRENEGRKRLKRAREIFDELRLDHLREEAERSLSEFT